MSLSPAQWVRRAAAQLAALFLILASAAPARAADQVYFSAVDDVAARLVERINAETVRIDMSAWYLTDSTVTNALLNRHRAGVKVRLIGDRGSIFEIDQLTKNTFYFLASQGVPIRLRYNPTWFPEIDHWKATIFVGQGIVSFGSPNYTPFELTPFSSSNYKDEVVLFTDDSSIVNAFKTKFDRYWNDTASEPESLIPTAPYFKNWDDACMNESACSDYRTQYPNPLPMVISTARLEPDNPLPPSIVWGQGPSFNNRLVTEIEAEQTAVDFVIYRLTVDNITQALLTKHQSQVPVRLIIEPDEYGNRKWPEFWITHANIDKLWAAGVQIKRRAHAGLTHMKVLITSNTATIASSNFAAAWQRDHNYFLSRTAKPAIHTAIKNRFQTMWTDQVGFVTFTPDPPDAPTPIIPAPGAANVPTTTTLTWDRAVFATSYDVYLGTSPGAMTLVANVPAQLVNDPPQTYSYIPPTPLSPNTTYFWRVVSKTNATPRDPSMIASSSNQTFSTAAAPPPGGPLPSPWQTQDIGAVGLSGTASFAAATGTFSVSGAGADIWGTADAFRYVYQGVNGDSEIVARVSAVQNTSPYAKAGVMLRQALTAGSAHVILDLRPDGWVEFMTRSANGGSTTYLSGASQLPPTWLKLTRSGNTVTGSVSSNGTTWTLVGSTTVSFGAAANLGLIVNSHNTAALNNSTFDNVTLTIGNNPPPPPPPGLPTPWTTQDIGSTGLTGGASHSNGVFTIAGAGGDIWGPVDAFRYVSQPTTGDVEIVARVTAIQNTHQWAKAGVMLRQSLTANSPHLLLDVTPGGTIEFLSRASSGAETTVVAFGSRPVPAWLRLTRSGNTVTAAISANGTTWTTVGSTTTTMPTSANIGLAVTSHDVNVLNTSTFDNLTVTTPSTPPPPPPPPPPGVPSPWTTQDVGSTGLAGNASHSNGVFTVAGAGGDIWGPVDAFRYVSQTTTGDTQITARVTAIQNTHQWAKAGVMLRQSLAANSPHLMLDVTPGGTIEFLSRASTGAETTVVSFGSQPVPAWLRLTRVGSTVTAAVSSNGTTWTTIGSTSTTIPTSANIGMVVTSHDVNTLNTSTFDNVTVTTPSTPPPPPPPPPTATNVVIYANDVPAAGRHGSWTTASDTGSPSSIKLVTTDTGLQSLDAPLASPTHYVDVTFNAQSNTPYRIWLRLKALNNSKFNDAVWVQFSDSLFNGAPIYRTGTTSGLLVNLATDASAASVNNWGWQNGAYWLSQATTITFQNSGSHTVRIQIREDGVQFDQIVLSPTTYLNASPGSVTNDSVIVPKP